MIRSVAAAAALMLAGTALAQTPVAELAKPPADAQKFTILSVGGKHGEATAWTLPDGTRMYRESVGLRGMVFEHDAAIRPGPGGMPASIVIRGSSPQGDSAETFIAEAGKAKWQSQIDKGEGPFAGDAYYSSMGGPFLANADFLEKIVAAPGQKLKLLPSGEARLARLDTVTIGEGAARKTLTGYAVEGVSINPFPFWVDEQGKYFGVISFLSVVPTGYEAAVPKLQAAQSAALARRGPALVQRFGRVAPTPVAFTNVRLFDAEGARFVDGQTVIAEAGKITAVGPAASVQVPANARRIDGAGKTLVPGLWDAHMHVAGDAETVMLLATGITSARDPGNNDTLSVDRAKRKAAGGLLSPTFYTSSLIDGKSEYTAQMATVATSQDEAIAAVRKAKADGHRGVKFYTSFNPQFLPAAVAEAKKLGLHVHGHVPASMRPADAIKAGYDEITHINFVMMQAMPDTVVNQANGIMRFEGPGRHAKDVDVNAEPLRSLIATMAEKKIYSDPTLVAFESMYVPENGDMSPSYAPFVGTLPVAMERGFKSGGFKPPAGVTRADYRASFGKMLALVSAMNKAGVPIVAGTDGSGLEIVHELELYVQAGMTPGEALRTATLVPARLVGADASTGSIAVGKEADLVLVDGDASRDISALRRVDWVMNDGALMNADELRQAAGFLGRPK